MDCTALNSDRELPQLTDREFPGGTKMRNLRPDEFSLLFCNLDGSEESRLNRPVKEPFNLRDQFVSDPISRHCSI